MLRVATYNIRKSIGTDRRRRPERVLAVLRELDADVVAVQEVDRRFGDRSTALPPEVIAEETGYMPVRFGIRPESLGWHGNMLLVRRDTEVLSTQRIELPALEPRGAVLADLRVGGTAVRVIGMHLGLLGLWRKRQARAVLMCLEALEDPLPTVMMGDLNEWVMDGGCLKLFARHHHVAAPGPSFHSRRPMAALDRIITSLDLRVEAAGVHLSPKSRVASDHLPVWADIVPAGPTAAAERHHVAQSPLI
ncbi:endonuclease/exonuclease/phosphatase family protein [Thalassobaculum sp.]|uniref:endonuclease/exonuclease/phosphatase family protein n=1 Tax=Thalassobaculum sp. TaxID=2022740 RepID=UPI0032EEDB68